MTSKKALESYYMGIYTSDFPYLCHSLHPSLDITLWLDNGGRSHGYLNHDRLGCGDRRLVGIRKLLRREESPLKTNIAQDVLANLCRCSRCVDTRCGREWIFLCSGKTLALALRFEKELIEVEHLKKFPKP